MKGEKWSEQNDDPASPLTNMVFASPLADSCTTGRHQQQRNSAKLVKSRLISLFYRKLVCQLPRSGTHRERSCQSEQLNLNDN